MHPRPLSPPIPLSRRTFTQAAALATIAPVKPAFSARPVTAEALLRRIQTELGQDWPPDGLDGLRAGDPSLAVTGLATAAMATLDVLKQAKLARTNLILTFEPAFYSRADGRSQAGAQPPADPVMEAKRQFIRDNGLVIFRFHDHWLARKSNDMVTGLATTLGWSTGRVNPDDALYDIAPSTAENTVAWIRAKLNLRAGLRAAGDRNATIRRVLLIPGSMPPATMWQRYAEADMIVAGEVREWENTHFAADLFTAGEKRALVTTGRVASEEPGMRLCADWLRTIITEVPTRWLPVGDPYWRPNA